MKTRSIKIPVWEFRETEGPYVREPIDSAREARAVIDRTSSPWTRECFGLLALNARSKLIGAEIVSIGTATAALVHPREIFRPAIALGAVTIVVFHNHPSGDPTPSNEDRDLTARLIEAGKILGIPVVDSIVVTPTRHESIVPSISGWR